MNNEINKKLSDEELEKVSGGGAYWHVTDCPHGYTKFVNWFFGQNSGGDKCKSCPNYIKTDVKDPIGDGRGNYKCTLMGDNKIWENF